MYSSFALDARTATDYTFSVGRKMRRVIIPAIMAAALLAALNACSMLGVTIMDRLTTFVGALNVSDRSTIASSFDSSQAGALAAVNWTADFPVPSPTADFPYSLSVQDYSNPSAVTANLTGPIAFNSTQGGPPTAATFAMVKIGADWFIEGATIGTIALP